VATYFVLKTGLKDCKIDSYGKSVVGTSVKVGNTICESELVVVLPLPLAFRTLPLFPNFSSTWLLWLVD
jgi:hypothetical protein